MKGSRNRTRAWLGWLLSLVVGPVVLLEAIVIGLEPLPLRPLHGFGAPVLTLVSLGLLARGLYPSFLGRAAGLLFASALGLGCAAAAGFHEDMLGLLRMGLHLSAGSALLGGVLLLASRDRRRRVGPAAGGPLLLLEAGRKGSKKISASEVVAGQRVTLSSGAREVPIDAEVQDGSASADLGGLFFGAESVVKRPGDVLLAGSRIDGALELEVKASAKDAFAVRAAHHTASLQEELRRSGGAERLLHLVLIAVPLSLLAFTFWTYNAELGWIERARMLGNVLLLATGVPAVFALQRAHGRAIEISSKRGLYLGRASDLSVLLGRGRVAIAPELTSAPGEVEVAAFSDVSADEILGVAVALLEDDDGPLAVTLAAERERRQQPPVRAAALRRTQAVFHGTVGGARWYLGPPLALEAEEKQKLSGAAAARFEVLSAKFPIVLLVGQPNRGLVGVLGVDLEEAPLVAQLGRRLGASLLPGQPDIVREVLSERTGLSAKARPMKKRDLAILRFRDLPPSAGLSLRVAKESDLVDHTLTDLAIVAEPALGKLDETLRSVKRARGRGRLKAGVLVLVQAAALLLAVFWPELPPLITTAVGFSVIAFGAWL